MKKTSNKVFTIIVNMVLILAVCFVGVVVVSSGSGRVPSLFGYSVLRVVSGSMEPEISVNDYIIIKKTEPDELKEGDIISFYSKDPSIYNKPNTHKIERVERGESVCFVTKGTANPKEDSYPVNKEDIIGKYVCKSAFLSFVFPMLSNPMVFLGLIIIPIIILVFTQLKERNKIRK